MLQLMFSIRPLSANVSIVIGGAPVAADLASIKAAGFSTLLDFRLDSEAQASEAAAITRKAAEALGLAYFRIPAAKHELFTDAVVAPAAALLGGTQGPILAHCASGQRAAIIWAAATARREPVGAVLKALRNAGFEFEFLRDDLEAQADRGRWMPQDSTEPVPAATKPANELEAA
jgi:uncharacterized protein (TIGR01244 family)